MLKWLDAREATNVGTALADDFVLHTASESATRRGDKRAPQGQELQKFLQKFLQRVDREAQPLKLNIFRRAKLANSFKWRLLERGVEKRVVEELTEALVLRLTSARLEGPASVPADVQQTRRPGRGSVQALLLQASEHTARGAHAGSVCRIRAATAARAEDQAGFHRRADQPGRHPVQCRTCRGVPGSAGKGAQDGSASPGGTDYDGAARRAPGTLPGSGGLVQPRAGSRPEGSLRVGGPRGTAQNDLCRCGLAQGCRTERRQRPGAVDRGGRALCDREVLRRSRRLRTGVSQLPARQRLGKNSRRSLQPGGANAIRRRSDPSLSARYSGAPASWRCGFVAPGPGGGHAALGDHAGRADHRFASRREGRRGA